MKNIQFPLDLNFHVGTLANDFTVKDATGYTIAYARQKIMKLVSEVEVFADETKMNLLYTIKADRMIDFSGTYTFTDPMGVVRGKVTRSGMKSLWKAHYEIHDANSQPLFFIQEVNPWVSVWDSFMRQIPLLGLFSGYLFHPSYNIVNIKTNTATLFLKKESSFLGNKFSVTKLQNLDSQDEEKVLLGVMMMIMLERRRG